MEPLELVQVTILSPGVWGAVTAPGSLRAPELVQVTMHLPGVLSPVPAPGLFQNLL